MKNLITILFYFLFFLPVAKGQGAIYGKVKNHKTAYDSIKSKILLDLALNQEKHDRYPGTQLLIDGNRLDKTVYFLDEKDMPLEFVSQNWLNTNKLRNKTYTENDLHFKPMWQILQENPALSS